MQPGGQRFDPAQVHFPIFQFLLNGRAVTRAAVFLLTAAVPCLLACVDSAAPDSEITVHILELAPPNPNLNVGDTVRLQAVPRDSIGRIATRARAQWSSEHPLVASVDSLGMVRAHSAGQTEIRAQVGSIVARVTVRVNARIAIRFVQVTAGMEHTCALTETGQVYCWGANRFAQLATSTLEQTATPTHIQLDEPVRAVVAGNRHNCAVGQGVWCWGANNAGQTGDWSFGDKVYQKPVHHLMNERMLAAAAGSGHSCALNVQGRIYCWGTNGLGQLGRGAASVIEQPAPVESEYHFTALAAGHAHTCAVTNDAAVACWGWNDFGQSGAAGSMSCENGTARCVLDPTIVSLPEGITRVTAGFAFTCALGTSGATYCWGVNAQGELGNGSTESMSATPVAVPAPRFSAIDAGTRHVCGITAVGETYCWGLNSKGELGVSSLTHSRLPVHALVERLHTIDAGLAHTCGVTDSGTVFCWGDPTDGQLGLGLPLSSANRTRHPIPSPETGNRKPTPNP